MNRFWSCSKPIVWCWYLMGFLAGVVALSVPSQAAGIGMPLGFFWATPVHNQMIELAFSGEDWACVEQLKAGSRKADAAAYQTPRYAFMHAMRAKGESAATGAAQMWRYVDSKYAEARLLTDSGRGDDSCYSRGMALHAIMDSTSPAHHGFALWDPIELSDLYSPTVIPGKLKELLRHGDVQKYLDRLALIPLPFNLSDEDMTVIDSHPEYLQLTADLLRTVNFIGMLKP